MILTETAFYPEAGGQLADHGTLAGLVVEDVQADDAGAVHHLLALAEGGALPAIGARVTGVVDKPPVLPIRRAR